MSSDDNHWHAHMTPTARNVCTRFATSSFNFGLPTYFVSHYYYRRALYAVFYGKVFFKESRADLLTVVWQMTCQRWWCALLVQFALVHLKFYLVWLRFALRRLPYT